VSSLDFTRVMPAHGAACARTVVIEFPDRELAEAFMEERSQSDLPMISGQTTMSRILLVDGCT
jgi:uncharacterized protein (DUF1330 family)